MSEQNTVLDDKAKKAVFEATNWPSACVTTWVMPSMIST
jgi:hypothetical protein